MILCQQSFNRITLFVAILNFCVSCSLSFTNLEYRRGIKALEKRDFKKSLEHFQIVIMRDPESEEAINSARKGSRVALFETKEYEHAIKYYQHLVKFSRNEKERRESQNKIAETYFEKLANYDKAIEEYNNLLLLRSANEEIIKYRFVLAKAHFYLNQFTESQNEIESALKLVEPEESQKFDLLMFLGNIYFNTKKADQAIKIYQDVLKNFPERAKKDNVAMNIVVCHEELEQFDKAIDILLKMRETYIDSDFIDLKIDRLKERKANLPGSKGLRK